MIGRTQSPGQNESGAVAARSDQTRPAREIRPRAFLDSRARPASPTIPAPMAAIVNSRRASPVADSSWRGDRGLAGRARESRNARAGFLALGWVWSLLAGLAGLVLAGLWGATDHVMAACNENLLQIKPPAGAPSVLPVRFDEAP